MLKQVLLAGAVCTASMASFTTAEAATVDVDLVFVIDRSGSMGNEGATLADRIAEVMAGIAADSGIGTVSAGVISYLNTSTIVQAITTSAAALETAIDGISYGGGTENGLGAMASLLPGGSNFGGIGWNNNTVRSIVLLTDEDADDDGGLASSYTDFGNLLDIEGYLNNVIVSDANIGASCLGLGGASTGGGCEYIPSSRPSGGDAAFDLVSFTTNTDVFIADFIDTKIQEIVITDPVGSVPLPAAGWLLIAGLGGLGAMRRRKGKASA